MFFDKKNIIIFVLGLSLSVCLFLLFKDDPKNLDIHFLENHIDSLNIKNNKLLNDIKVIKSINTDFENKIDSLLNVKPKINIKYVTKYKEIDDANAFKLISLSDSIFTANGIK